MISFILFFLGFIIGAFIGSFTLISVLICIFFGIPTAKKLTRSGFLINPNPIVKNYMLSIIILSSFFIGISLLIYLFASSKIFFGYVFGVIITFVIGVGKTGTNKSNLEDFMEANKKYIAKNKTP